MTKFMNIIIISLILSFVSCTKSEDLGEKFYLVGKDFFNQNQLDKAETSFKKSIEEDDDFLNSHFMLAKIYYFNKKEKEAFKELEIILGKNENHIDALYWKAKLLAISSVKDLKDKKNNEFEAIKCLKKILEINYHHLPARQLLAILYEKNNQYKQAMYEYLKILQEEKTLQNTRANMSILFMKLGLKDKSLEQINKAISIADIEKLDNKNLIIIKEEIEK